MSPAPDRARTASAALTALAGPTMYRHNPFRVTGLPTTASAKEIRLHRQRVLGALQVGAHTPISQADAEVTRAAFDALAATDSRLAGELLWLWGEPDGCGCSPEAHAAHDTAVRVHSAALESDDPPWADVARSWSVVLADESLWDHMRHRVAVLGDRAVDESTVDGFRLALPDALLAPQAATATIAAAEAIDTWPFDQETLDNARRAAGAGAENTARDLIAELRTQAESGGNLRAGTRMLKELKPVMRTLDRFLPHTRFRQSAALRESAAILLNNSALALQDDTTIRYARLIPRLLKASDEFAVAEDTAITIKGNKSGHAQLAANPSALVPALLLLYFDLAAFVGFGVGLPVYLVAPLVTVVGVLPKVFVLTRRWRTGGYETLFGIGVACAVLLATALDHDPVDVAVSLGVFILSQPLARRAAEAILDRKEPS